MQRIFLAFNIRATEGKKDGEQKVVVCAKFGAWTFVLGMKTSPLLFFKLKICELRLKLLGHMFCHKYSCEFIGQVGPVYYDKEYWRSLPPGMIKLQIF